MFLIQKRSTNAATNAARYAMAVLLLTSVHHAYGAYIYATPWRYHVVPVAGITTIAMLAPLALMRSRPSGLLRTVARALFVLVTLAVPVVTFGVFEGLYNHVVKDLLYFGARSPALMTRLFPPPLYEMPNDAFFEITGILQVVPGGLAAWYVYRMLQERRTSQMRRIQTGSVLTPRELVSVRGEAVRIPDPDRLVHLQFRRFAGCPVCDLHLHSFVRRHDEIAARGVREVIVFHSTDDDVRHYESHLPMTTVADPDKRLYQEFGVDDSPRALLDPHVWSAVVRGVLHSAAQIGAGRPIPPIKPDGGSLGLPADFLIANDGTVLACKYGVHANDQWSLDELLGFVPNPRTTGDAQTARASATVL